MDPTALLASSGLLVIFLVLLLKEAGVPIPVPGDLIIITAGIQAAAGSLNLAQAIAVILLAGLIGASVQYGVARGPGRRFIQRFGRYAGLTPGRLDRLTRGLRSRGARSVALTRITPGVRTATAVAAGWPACRTGPFCWELARAVWCGFSFTPCLATSLNWPSCGPCSRCKYRCCRWC